MQLINKATALFGFGLAQQGASADACLAGVAELERWAV
jgi:hypothetical protein